MQQHREHLANGRISVWQDGAEMVIHHADGLTIGLNDKERAALFEWLKKGLVKTWLLKLKGTGEEFMFDSIEKQHAINEARFRWNVEEDQVTAVLYSRSEYLGVSNPLAHADERHLHSLDVPPSPFQGE